MKLSTVILAKNEEGNIKECLESVKFSDEIIVLDDYSTDRTIDIAKNFNAKIAQRSLNGDFSAQRNYGLKLAKGEWVLFLDADERVSRELKDEIVYFINNPLKTFDGFIFKRKDIIWGHQFNFGENGKTKLLRLAKKQAGFWKRKVHEVWQIKGNIYIFKNPLFHYPHQDLKEFIFEINGFSSLHADANRNEKKRSNIFKIICYPLLKFANIFIIKLGFLDGLYGFVVALLMSVHSYLAWSKLWIMQKEK